uniref:Uncharacterized protein n=1 Tax=Arundo donax TaxID=35708 RepID=A0A0A8YT66_ARUDO
MVGGLHDNTFKDDNDVLGHCHH